MPIRGEMTPQFVGDFMSVSFWRSWLRRGLTVLAVCALVAAVSAILQGVLRALGDDDGAAAVRGVLLVAVTGAALCVIGLVVALAAIEIRRDEPRDE
jgi:hypothetical protein